jgi:hypothetical protein
VLFYFLQVITSSILGAMNKAKRAVITIAGIELDGFQRDERYFLSQSQVAEAVGVNSSLVLRFLKANCPEGKADKDFSFCKLATESSSNKGKGGERFIVAIPPKLASLFWGYQARKGNDKALALVCACAEEALERRLDRAFESVKTEEDRVSVYLSTSKFFNNLFNNFRL